MVKKIAAPPAPPPGYVPVALSNPAAPIAPIQQTHNKFMPTAPNRAVKEMQTAIIDLYNSFQYYPMFHKDPNYREGNTKEYAESYEHGSDPFLTFLLNRYINKSPVAGQDAAKYSNKSKPNNLIKLVDSLKNIGKQTVSNEVSAPDGVWAQKTTDALNSVYSITQGMLGLMNKLNIKSSNYSEESLNELKKLISKTNNSQAAQAITKNIADIKKLVGDFMANMDRERGQFSAYVRQEKPFEAHFGNKAVEYNAKDNQTFDILNNSASITLFNIPQDIATGQGQIPLVVENLFSKQTFDDFIKENKITVNGQDPTQNVEARNELLNNIEQQIKAMNVTPPSDDKIVREIPKGY